MTKKYADGLPLARQKKIRMRDGIDISRAAMANRVIQCTRKWLKLLYGHMRRQLLTENVIHADETVVQVHREDGKSSTSESRMRGSAHHSPAFELSPNLSQQKQLYGLRFRSSLNRTGNQYAFQEKITAGPPEGGPAGLHAILPVSGGFFTGQFQNSRKGELRDLSNYLS